MNNYLDEQKNRNEDESINNIKEVKPKKKSNFKTYMALVLVTSVIYSGSVVKTKFFLFIMSQIIPV
jgi:hypothetical protein